MNQEHAGQSVIEASQEASRYFVIKALGEETFANSHLTLAREPSPQDVLLLRDFMREAAHLSNPPVWAEYWEHVLIAPELGSRLAEQAHRKGLITNPYRVPAALWLHDMGVMVTPAYNRKDWLGNSLLRRIGIPPSLLTSLTSTHRLMDEAQEMDLSEKQIKLEQPLNLQQQKTADNYFYSLTPEQRITNLADNLGKRVQGELLSLTLFKQYLLSQEIRYGQTSPWPSTNYSLTRSQTGEGTRRTAGAALQYYTVEKTITWLTNAGIDVDAVLKSLADYGPKYLVIVRHGELDNPTEIVYTRDQFMGDQIMHLSSRGQEQMSQLGKELRKRRFTCRQILVSPETRTQESADYLNRELDCPSISTSPNLDDASCPGPFFEGMKMATLREMGGNTYDPNRWAQYNHETPESITLRMQQVFSDAWNRLNIGQTAVLVTHGDPSAWLINSLSAPGLMLPPENLREQNYLAKGQAEIVVTYPSSSKVFCLYRVPGEIAGQVY